MKKRSSHKTYHKRALNYDTCTLRIKTQVKNLLNFFKIYFLYVYIKNFITLIVKKFVIKKFLEYFTCVFYEMK